MGVHQQGSVSAEEPLAVYLAAEAAWKLRLAPHYRERAALKRYSAEDLRVFLESPEGYDGAELRAVLAVEVERIRMEADEWEKRAEEAERFGLTYVRRDACGAA